MSTARNLINYWRTTCTGPEHEHVHITRRQVANLLNACDEQLDDRDQHLIDLENELTRLTTQPAKDHT
jgi:hypothetical protein